MRKRNLEKEGEGRKKLLKKSENRRFLISLAVSQLTSHLVNQSTSHLVNQSISHLVNQSTSQLTNQSASQSISLLIRRLWLLMALLCLQLNMNIDMGEELGLISLKERLLSRSGVLVEVLMEERLLRVPNLFYLFRMKRRRLSRHLLCLMLLRLWRKLR